VTEEKKPIDMELREFASIGKPTRDVCTLVRHECTGITYVLHILWDTLVKGPRDIAAMSRRFHYAVKFAYYNETLHIRL